MIEVDLGHLFITIMVLVERGTPEGCIFASLQIWSKENTMEESKNSLEGHNKKHGHGYSQGSALNFPYENTNCKWDHTESASCAADARKCMPQESRSMRLWGMHTKMLEPMSWKDGRFIVDALIHDDEIPKLIRTFVLTDNDIIRKEAMWLPAVNYADREVLKCETRQSHRCVFSRY